MTNQMIDYTDQVSGAELKRLAGLEGAWVTITMPTHRTGAETRQDPIRFRNLSAAALQELADLGVADASIEAISATLDEMGRDHDFWQHQTGGLVVAASPDEQVIFRLGGAVGESAAGDHWPRLAQLVPSVADDSRFRVLVLSAESVRLLEGTLNSLGELDLGPIPADYDEAFGHLEQQKHLQHSTHPSGSQYHGHGAGSTAASNAITRYLRAVAAGLDERLRGEPTAPLVLAGSNEITGEFRQISGRPEIIDQTLSGSHQQTPLHELHEAAWPLVVEAHSLGGDEANDRIAAAWSRDEALLDVTEIIRAAEQARVSDIFIDPDTEPSDQVEQALRLTLQTGGAVHALAQPQGRALAALLRY